MGQKFDVERFKIQLKLARCRLDNLLKQHRNTNSGRRREIANLLQTGHEDRARVHVKYLIRDDYLMEAYEMLLTACDDLLQSAGLIAREPTLEADLIPPAKSLLYAAGRIDAPELDRIKEQIEAKFGREFGDVNSEVGRTMVDPSLVVKLAIRSPDTQLVNKYLVAIAQIFGVAWEPPAESPLLNEPIPAPLGTIPPSLTQWPTIPSSCMPLPLKSPTSPIMDYPPTQEPPPSYSVAVGQESPSAQQPSGAIAGSQPSSTPPPPLPSENPSSNNSVPDFEELNRRFRALKGER